MEDRSGILKVLRERYYAAKAKSDELGGGNVAANHVKYHGVQAGKLYSAVSTLLYASISVSKTEELEKYVLKKGTSLPTSVFDMQEWAPFLEMARRVRAASAKAMPLDGAASVPGVSGKTESEIRQEFDLQVSARLRGAEQAAAERAVAEVLKDSPPASASGADEGSAQELVVLRSKLVNMERENSALQASLERERKETAKANDAAREASERARVATAAASSSSSISPATPPLQAPPPDLGHFESLLRSNEGSYERMLEMQERQWKARADMDQNMLSSTQESLKAAQARVLQLESDLRDANQRDRDSRVEHAAALKAMESEQARVVSLLERDVALARASVQTQGASNVEVAASKGAEVEHLRSRLRLLESDAARLVTAEAEVRSLRAELNDANKRATITPDFHHHQAVHEHDIDSAMVQSMRLKVVEAETKVAAMAPRLASAESRVEVLSGELEEARKQYSTSHQDSVELRRQMSASFSTSSQELTALRSQLAVATGSASEETRQLHAQVSSLREALSSKEREIAQATSSAASQSSEMGKLEAQVVSLKEQTTGLQEQLETKSREVTRLTHERAAAVVASTSSDTSAVDRLAAELDSARRTIRTLSSTLTAHSAVVEMSNAAVKSVVSNSPKASRGPKTLGRPGILSRLSLDSNAHQPSNAGLSEEYTQVSRKLETVMTELENERQQTADLKLKLDRANESSVVQVTKLRNEIQQLQKGLRKASLSITTAQKKDISQLRIGGYKHISMAPAVYNKRVVIVQSVIRRFIARSRVQRLRLIRDSASNGVLAAMPGTIQGHSGWYTADDKIYYFCREGKEFMLVVGPLSMEQYEASIVLFRRSLGHEDVSLDSGTLGTGGGSSGTIKNVRVPKNIALSRLGVVACRVQIDALTADLNMHAERIEELEAELEEEKQRVPSNFTLNAGQAYGSGSPVQMLPFYSPTAVEQERLQEKEKERVEAVRLVSQLEGALMVASQENRVLRAHVSSMQAQLVAAEDYLYSARESVGVATTAADAARLAAAAAAQATASTVSKIREEERLEEERLRKLESEKAVSAAPHVSDVAAKKGGVGIDRLDLGPAGVVKLSLASQVQVSTPRLRRIVKMQALARGFVGRSRVRNLKSHVSRQSDGMLRAMRGTSQGCDGWYQAPNGMVYYFVLREDDWTMVGGPLTITEFLCHVGSGKACERVLAGTGRGDLLGLVRGNLKLSGLRNSMSQERCRWVEERVYLDARTLEMCVAVPVRDMMGSLIDEGILSMGSRGNHNDVAVASVEED